MPLKDVRFQTLVDYCSRLSQEDLEDIDLIARLKGVKQLRLMIEGAKRHGNKEVVQMLSLALLFATLKDAR